MIFHIFVPADMDYLVRLVRDFLALVRKAYPNIITAEFKQEDEE